MDLLDSLMQKLGYKFKDITLLQAALTHRSVKGKNNERLEFFGDAFLNFIIAEQLYILFDTAKEGELSRWRASLVNGETLAEIAKEFRLGEYLRLGPGELKSGGFTRKSILADALEAIIGAIYFDANFGVCRDRVLNWFKTRLKAIHPYVEKDPKTKLQEYLQAKHLPLPRYEILALEGEAHAQLFHIKCQVAGFSFATEGTGSSRRKAEQFAAEKYLDLLKK
jgi:ribonuclease III